MVAHRVHCVSSLLMTHSDLLRIKPSEPTTVNNNGSLSINTSICHMECDISSSFTVEMFVLLWPILLMIFLNQNNTTNAKILHYAINNNPYLCQSTESAYHINSYITRAKILEVLPNSARGTVHTRTDQIMDTRAVNDCLGDLHTRKTNIFDKHYIYSLLSLHDQLLQ